MWTFVAVLAALVVGFAIGRLVYREPPDDDLPPVAFIVLALLASGAVVASAECGDPMLAAMLAPNAPAFVSLVRDSTGLAVELTAFDGALKAFQVTVALAPGQVLRAVEPGAYVAAADSFPLWSVTTNDDSSRTIVGAFNPGMCQHTPGGGPLVHLDIDGPGLVHLVPSPVGCTTPSPALKDCERYDIVCAYGVSVLENSPVPVPRRMH